MRETLTSQDNDHQKVPSCPSAYSENNWSCFTDSKSTKKQIILTDHARLEHQHRTSALIL